MKIKTIKNSAERITMELKEEIYSLWSFKGSSKTMENYSNTHIIKYLNTVIIIY